MANDKIIEGDRLSIGNMFARPHKTGLLNIDIKGLDLGSIDTLTVDLGQVWYLQEKHPDITPINEKQWYDNGGHM